MSSDGEVTLLETASYRLVGRLQADLTPQFWLEARIITNRLSLDDYEYFIEQLGHALWGKERQP